MKSTLAIIIRRFFRILFWILPVVILFFIYQRVPVAELILLIKKTNISIFILGLLFYPVTILIGAIRWKMLLKLFSKTHYSLISLIKQYWIGLSIGFFAPASVGWDLYRIVSCGKKDNSYFEHIYIIIIEKVLALLCISAILIVTYQLIIIKFNPIIQQIISISYYTLIGILVVITIFLFYKNHFRKLFEKYANYLLAKIGLKTLAKTISISLNYKIFFQYILLNLFLTFCIQIFSTVSTHYFFRSLGIDFPFITNLFISPLLFFIFLLPISFGGVGVRETAYIFLYGLFGVDAKIALVLSIFGFMGILLNNLIGVFILIYDNFQKRKHPIV